MSLYNQLYGVTRATFFILPMLGKHPDAYPRFRDCFMEPRKWIVEGEMPVMVPDPERFTPEFSISVLTRIGGENRKSHEEEIKGLKSDPFYIEDFDDEFDPTYATFVFSVPKKWQKDYSQYRYKCDPRNFSEIYRKQIYKVYPLLREKLDGLFKEVI